MINGHYNHMKLVQVMMLLMVFEVGVVLFKAGLVKVAVEMLLLCVA